MVPRYPGARADNSARILDSLEREEATAVEVVERTSLSGNQVAYALRALLEGGLVVRRGGRGQRTTYCLPTQEVEPTQTAHGKR